jgi:hypothetical protein
VGGVGIQDAGKFNNFHYTERWLQLEVFHRLRDGGYAAEAESEEQRVDG